MKVVYVGILLCVAAAYAALCVYVYTNFSNTGDALGGVTCGVIFITIMTFVIVADSAAWEPLPVVILLDLLLFMPWIVTYILQQA